MQTFKHKIQKTVIFYLNLKFKFLCLIYLRKKLIVSEKGYNTFNLFQDLGLTNLNLSHIFPFLKNP